MAGTENSEKLNRVQADRRRVLTLIFVFALSLRLINLMFLSQAPFFEFKIGDAARYDAWASEIAGGKWVGDEVFYQAPLYPYFLAVIYSTFGNSIFLVKFIQAGMAAISCTMLAAAAWNFFSRRAAIAAGIVMACYVPSLFLESLLQKSVLDLFFVSLIVWLSSRVHVNQSLRNWLYLGLGIGGLCLTRENALALIPVFAVASVVYRTTAKSLRHAKSANESGWRQALIRTRTAFPMYVLGLAIVLGPVAMRNYAIGGEWHITTSQLGPNFYIGNHLQADGLYHPLVVGRGDAQFEQADAVAIAERESGRQLSAAEVSNYYLHRSRTFIVDHPRQWLTLIGKKTLLSINSTEIVDTEDQYVYQQASPVLFLLSPIFQFGVLFPIALLSIWSTRHRWRSLWVLYAMIGVFQLTLIAFFVFGRYRLPVVPVLVVFAAPVIANTWLRLAAWFRKNRSVHSWGQSKPSVAWAGIAFLIALVSICHLPLISKRSQASVTYNNFAIQSLVRSQWKQAEDFLQASLKYDSDFALAHNSKGVLHRQRGEISEAKYHFQVAVELEPDYENAQKNLETLQAK